MKFEFAVEIMSPHMIERQSANYEKEYQDTANNLMIGRPLVPPSGSIGENLVIDETLGVIAVDWKKLCDQIIALGIRNGYLL